MAVVPADSAGIARAAALLREGQCVAFPTETVYGLGADATQDKAVASIYAIKGRPQFNPLIIHVAEAAQLDALVQWNDTARQLAHRFWPGALTLILPTVPNCPVSLLARAGLPSLAVRVPDHPVAQALLRAVDRPIAAPSANRSGRLSPTTPIHVQQSLGEAVPLILAGGKTAVGVESTIIDCTVAPPVILRHGGVSQEQIEQCLNVKLDAAVAARSTDAPTAPGQLASHYAPQHPIRLQVATAREDEAFLLFGPELGLRGGRLRKNLSPSGDLHEAAANLFAYLHELDATDCSGIAVSTIPEIGLGRAINDRLRRAAVLPDVSDEESLITVTRWVHSSKSDAYPEIPWGWVKEFPDPCDWPTYLECIAPATAPYVKALREDIVAKQIRYGGDWHQNAPNGTPIFSDGTRLTTSFRAWGRLLAAIWTSEDGKKYRYTDFYMDGDWPVEG